VAITCGRASGGGSTAVAVAAEMATGIEAHCMSSSGGLWQWQQRYVTGGRQCGGGSKGG
jgi:hypothetical protein